MTTTISLATRDCIVLGCDSLATSINSFLDPYRIADHFFEADGAIKRDGNGDPTLKTAAQLAAFITQVPRDQLPNVTKLYQLKPLKIGLTFAGRAGLGNLSVKNLVDSFLADDSFKPLIENHPTVETAANCFFDFTKNIYDQHYGSLPDHLKPVMEILLSGYSPASLQPEVFRLELSPNAFIKPELSGGVCGIVYSGQYDVIQRVVRGLDLASYIALHDRSEGVLNVYHQKLQAFLTSQNIQVELPTPDMNDGALKLFGSDLGGIKGLNANHDSLSEQAAINFVEFLIDTMIKAQQFSGSIPTVGGEIHIAIITKAGGFKWISKEEYTFRGHAVSKH